MPEKKFKVVINGKEYTRIEDVPQPLRWLIQKGMDAAAARGITGLPGQEGTTKETFKVVFGEPSKLTGPADPAPPGAGPTSRPEPIQPVRSSVLPLVLCALALLGWLAYHFALAGR